MSTHQRPARWRSTAGATRALPQREIGQGRHLPGEVLDERHVVPGVRFAVDAYVTFARTRPWVEAVASGLTEMFSGHLMQRRVGDMLANYDWIKPADLAYFTNRIEAVSGAGKSTVDIVVRYSTTRAQQDAAIAALSFKCDVLWSMLDAIERAAAKE